MPEQTFHAGIKALLTNSKGEILVLKSGPAEKKWVKRDFWDLPGGRIKKGQSIEQTLEREVEEELGIPGKSVKIRGLFDACISNFYAHGKGKTRLLIITYKCTLHSNKKFKLSSEHSEWKWASPKQAKKLLSDKFPKSLTNKLDSLKK